MPGTGSSYGFLNDALCDDWQLLVLVLTQCTQSFQGFGFGSAAPAHHDADSTLDHPAATQGRLQLAG